MDSQRFVDSSRSFLIPLRRQNVVFLDKNSKQPALLERFNIFSLLTAQLLAACTASYTTRYSTELNYGMKTTVSSQELVITDILFSEFSDKI